MAKSQSANSYDLIDRRLDELHLSASDAARAKASLRTADVIVDFRFTAAAAIRASGEFVARHAKSAFTSSPQH